MASHIQTQSKRTRDGNSCFNHDKKPFLHVYTTYGNSLVAWHF